MSPLLQLEICDSIALLRFLDAPSRNSLSPASVAALEEAFHSLTGNPAVHAVVFAGLPEYFCTGASRDTLRHLAAGGPAPRDLLLPRALLDLDVPLVAALEGHALGGGLALALCADLSVAANESRYGCNFIHYGFTPGMGTTALLEYQFGPALAHEMLYTGATFRGARLASSSGFNYVLPRAEVLPKALDLAAALAAHPRPALTALKTSLASTRRRLFEQARSAEALMHRLTFRPELVARAIEDEYPA